MLNKTPFIVEELIHQGLISADNSSKVEAIINGDFESKEYNLKKQIEEALSSEFYYYELKSLVDLENVNAVYSIITSKFKEDTELTRQDIKDQVKQYCNKKYADKIRFQLSDNRASLFTFYLGK